mmetsp:Transcript_7890/g.21549  ORF Transcript_7890/g.21549 Transcript_7890/m.21549 type:complete len:685 (+) Transcript_7890:105-2159(+)
MTVEFSSPSSMDLMANPVLDVALSILRACPWRERGYLLQLNRAWAANGNAHMFEFMCRILEESHGLYLPAPPEGTERKPAEWRDIFHHLLPSAHVWQAAATSPRSDGRDAASARAPTARSLIKVCVRFRPKRRTPAGSKEGDEDLLGASRVVLPLHQRLQLIKASHRCTSSEAQKLLWAPGSAEVMRDDPFAAPKGVSEALAREPRPTSEDAAALGDMTNTSRQSAADPDKALAASVPGGGSGSLLGSAGEEAAAGEGTDVQHAHLFAAHLTQSTRAGLVAADKSGVVFCAPTIGLREFRFNAAFGPLATQQAVYERSLRPLLVDFINGRSGCLLAFGQTGSGKTFTMSGPDEGAATTLGPDVGPAAGLVPRALRELLSAVAVRERRGIRSQVLVSFVEIYGEDVTDLLRDGEHLGAWRGVAARALAAGRADVAVDSEASASQLLLRGERSKRRAATAMNERSSRAHSVFTLTLVQSDDSAREVRSTLCLADLGGSEQLKRSKAEGDKLREAVQINLGLLALKNCVTALTEGARYVPYQNSKLTQLLMPGLSGHAQTVVVVCGSTDPVDASETLEALRFGELCAVLESESKLPTASLMAQTLRTLDEQIAEVEKEIVAKERWETVVERRADERAFAAKGKGADYGESLVDTGVEEKRTAKLVGAEAERERLEELLERRRELLGE